MYRVRNLFDFKTAEPGVLIPGYTQKMDTDDVCSVSNLLVVCPQAFLACYEVDA